MHWLWHSAPKRSPWYKYTHKHTQTHIYTAILTLPFVVYNSYIPVCILILPIGFPHFLTNEFLQPLQFFRNHGRLLVGILFVYKVPIFWINTLSLTFFSWFSSLMHSSLLCSRAISRLFSLESFFRPDEASDDACSLRSSREVWNQTQHWGPGYRAIKHL